MHPIPLAVAIVLAARISMAVDVPEFRPGTLELSLGPSGVFLPREGVDKAGVIGGAALALPKWDLIAFADWTHLAGGGRGSLTLQGQLLAGGVQIQLTRVPLPYRIVPFVESGTALTNLQIVRLPVNTLFDNDAGNRVAWLVGGGIRIPFGRDKLAGLRLAYRHFFAPAAIQRTQVSQVIVQMLFFIRSR